MIADTPLIANRWDYVYRLRAGTYAKREMQISTMLTRHILN